MTAEILRGGGAQSQKGENKAYIYLFKQELLLEGQV